MAKKKKKSSLAKPAAPAARTPRGDAADPVFLWLTAFGGLLLVLVFLFVPWVSVMASGKNGLTLIGEAFGKDSWVGIALLYTVLVGAVSAALPFVPPVARMREWAATLVAAAVFIDGFVMTIVARSTRNMLAFGAGRQQVLDTVYLIFMAMLVIFVGSVGFLARKDAALHESREPVRWYAVFLVVLIAILYFNYAILPDSIIAPPEFIRQRMQWLR